MRFLVTALLAFATLIGASSSSNRAETFSVRLPIKNREQIQKLAADGFDIAGVDFEKGEFVVLTDAVGVTQLGPNRGVRPIHYGIVLEVLDSSWKKPSDIPTILRKYESQYPDLVGVTTIGKTVDGADIYAVRITDSFTAPAHGKAVVLFDAMHHAREVMTPEVAIDILDYLTTNATTDPKVQAWLVKNEIWVVPMVNPDGNQTVWTQDNMWRKNMQGGYGVDINRNYPYAWGTCNGSSGNRNSETYRGSSAGSEPETKALMDLARAIKPAFNISYHSASEIVIYPMSCPGVPPPAAQKPLIESIGRDLASKLTRDSGSGTYSPGYCYDLLYPVDGGSIDWMYSELQTLAYCIEVSSQTQGFQPSYSRWRDSTVKRNRAGWMWVLDRTTSSAIRAQTAPGQLVALESSNGQKIMTKTADYLGWVHFIVAPGTYSVGDPSNRGGFQTTTVKTGVSVVYVKR
jgi:carboxypeptidase T